nr:hypothetical protein L204_05254 [Cryptococcus depauperatus CBS 7855]
MLTLLVGLLQSGNGCTNVARRGWLCGLASNLRQLTHVVDLWADNADFREQLVHLLPISKTVSTAEAWLCCCIQSCQMRRNGRHGVYRQAHDTAVKHQTQEQLTQEETGSRSVLRRRMAAERYASEKTFCSIDREGYQCVDESGYCEYNE